MGYHYVVAGAGLSGSVFARQMAEKGYEILVLERRQNIAGNLYDEKNSSNILVQRYGPHVFHTNNIDVLNFIMKYGIWKDFRLKCEVEMCNKSTPSPFNFKTIDQFYDKDKAQEIKKALLHNFPGQRTVTIVDLLNCTVPLIHQYAEMLFKNDYSLYTAKQWGINANEIDVSVLKRVPVRLDYEEMYFTDKYQCMPENGFTDFVGNVLNHSNITVKTKVNALDYIKFDQNQKIIKFSNIDVDEKCVFVYTGAIDELFDYSCGELPYRSLSFRYETIQKESFQNAPVVAYPQEKDFTRITEYKKLPEQNISGLTTIVYEYPLKYEVNAKSEPYYPIPTESSSRIYSKYQEMANTYCNLLLCGRLAEYKYYNMDQAIASILDKTN